MQRSARLGLPRGTGPEADRQVSPKVFDIRILIAFHRRLKHRGPGVEGGPWAPSEEDPMRFGFGDARPGLRALMLTAAGGLGLLLLTASPAQAGDEFERGFKDEIGRIAAHEAFGLGRHIVADVFLGGGHGHYYQRPVHYQTYYRHSYYRDRHDRGHRRHRGHFRGNGHRRHYDRHHHGHGCGH